MTNHDLALRNCIEFIRNVASAHKIQMDAVPAFKIVDALVRVTETSLFSHIPDDPDVVANVLSQAAAALAGPVRPSVDDLMLYVRDLVQLNMKWRGVLYRCACASSWTTHLILRDGTHNQLTCGACMLDYEFGARLHPRTIDRGRGASAVDVETLACVQYERERAEHHRKDPGAPLSPDWNNAPLIEREPYLADAKVGLIALGFSGDALR